ncbi:hypothetical protein CTA1_9835 [Colletotrichum tanaceti]|uniref:Uncharacterized protein n=1 Tax=Colletotrichum tanaceti TaxID=1306861 RepID=A0A4U6XQ94_9PEZI|nr:hypothetical protein CTA1_9835 [Colletotrichum tanaceti]
MDFIVAGPNIGDTKLQNRRGKASIISKPLDVEIGATKILQKQRRIFLVSQCPHQPWSEMPELYDPV